MQKNQIQLIMKQILHNFATISTIVKRNLLSLVFILVFFSANGQNGIIGSGFTNGWNTEDIISFTAGAGSSRISTLQPKGTDRRYFRLVRWGGNLTQFGPYGCVDTPWNSPGITYGMSVCGNGAFYIDCPNTTDNYVFKTPNGDSATTLLYFRVQGDVRTIDTVTQFPVAGNVATCSGTTVTANLSGALATGQAVYLRYTKDGYATSIVVQLTGSGTTYTGTIPQAFNTLSANVSYYVFTSGTTTPSGADADFYTINLNNNSGTNYTYTVNTATTTTWNGTAWSTCSPTSSIDAIIDGTYSTTANGAFSAKSVTVNFGKTLIIASGTNVTVQNAVVNNGTLTIQNNANLIQVNDVTNTGTVTVTRNSAALKRLDYTMWSSPVLGTQKLQEFSPNTFRDPNRFYTYNGGNAFAAIATTSTFEAGKGYLIRMPNDASTSPESFEGVFIGTLNNGTVTVSGLDFDKYYSVGNPYPSTISANAFLTANPGTLYFWRKTNGASGGAYATYNGTGAASAAGSEVPDGTIQVGQGFIAKTGADANQLVFTNAMRLGTTTNQFFKTKNTAEKSRVWLDLTATGGLFSQALVGYLDGATLGVDNGYDGKYLNDSPTDAALTSIVDGGEYTIQGRPAFDVTDVVALGFKTGTAGDFTIAINKKDGALATQDIYLVDSKTGIETDLNAGSYTFAAEAGVDNTRFSLKYQKTLKVDAPAFNDNSVSVYNNNGTLYVNSRAKAINNVKVYDIQGRIIAQQNNVKANTATISNLKATHQVLIVKVTSEDNKVISKKVVN